MPPTQMLFKIISFGQVQYYVNVICSGINFNPGVRDFDLITMIDPGGSAWTSWREL